MEIGRRKFLGGLGAIICAPAIVRASSLMTIKAYAQDAIVPGQFAPSLYADLCAVTRRAYVPRLYVDIYRADPLLNQLTSAA